MAAPFLICGSVTLALCVVLHHDCYDGIYKCWEDRGDYEIPLQKPAAGERMCINMWDEGCNNGQLGGAGNDDDYLNGGFNPGKRCVNMWDEGCINGQLNGAGNDDNYLGGGFNPGKRCANMWDEGCINGQLGGSGNDDGYLNGGFNPGKRSLQSLLQKLQNRHHQ